MKKVKIGVFDIDGTIFRSSLLIELVRGLVRAGVFPKRANKEMEADYLAWLDRVGDYDDYLGKVIRTYDNYLLGKKFSKAEAVAAEVMRREKNKTYRFTRDLILELKKKKYYLIAISGSPSYMVDKFAFHMGFDVSFGAVTGVRSGVFTNYYVEKDFKTGNNILISAKERSKVLNFSRKDILLKRYLSSRNLSIDWKESIAAGDSGNDIQMLKLVGHPIAFNPDDILLKEARRKGWRVVVERKNVVYDLKRFDFIPYKK
jgi:HAD superfamily phosphoserine phosphatase-like hydrolase